jgi:hypothetical protein
MRKSDRVLVCVALVGVAIGAAPAHAAVYTTFERGPDRFVQAHPIGRRGGMLHSVAEQANSPDQIPEKCKAPAKWEALRTCLEERKRVLFEPAPTPLEAEGMRTLSGVQERGKEEEAPVRLPATSQEQLERSKAQTLRRFETQESLDVQQDLRELRDLLNAQ